MLSCVRLCLASYRARVRGLFLDNVRKQDRHVIALLAFLLRIFRAPCAQCLETGSVGGAHTVIHH
jgi:hypothetical protein